ncbi:MAG: Uma2 family endonuclease [Candidatus Xenobia bacterium]
MDGVIYMASPDTADADDLNSFVLFLMKGYVRRRNLGHVSGSRYAYRLNEHRAPEPDIAFVTAARVSSVITRREGLGVPDGVVEGVARDSRSRDYGEKKDLYQQAGVKEYWIIDPMTLRAEFWELRDGVYQMMPLGANHLFTSSAVSGFWLDVNWLFGGELPDHLTCLEAILNAPA